MNRGAPPPAATAAAPVRLSVLMVTYGGDNAAELDAALASLAAQTRPADEVVLVRNGPLGPALAGVIAAWQARLPLAGPALAQDSPFPEALNAGLAACTGDIVARMDADDVCRADRFALQLAHLAQAPETDVLGSAIGEFETDPARPHRARHMPETPRAIARFARWRNPMNHMTVMFRRTVVAEAGGYRNLPGFEDYELWVRLIARGRRLENRPEPLVAARIGNGFTRRRRGLRYALAEWRAMGEIARTWKPGALPIRLAMPLRFVLRCLPSPATALAYGMVRRRPAPGAGTAGK